MTGGERASEGMGKEGREKLCLRDIVLVGGGRA